MVKKILGIIKKEKNLSTNILGAFLVKGASMLLSLFTMPAYIRYFQDNVVLGIWYTMLSVLTWITMFDLGIGNGLRNMLAESLAKGDRKSSQEYISSSYIIITIVSCALAFTFTIANRYINWNVFLNVSDTVIDRSVLRKGMAIIIYGIFLRFVLGLINSILYALQKSAVNNFLVFITNLAIFIYVSIAPSGDIMTNLINLSYWQVILTNGPLVIATVFVFLKPLKGLYPAADFFRIEKAKSVLNMGLVLLWLQVVAMVILSTHAFLISRFVGPEQVVEYNIYYKVFNSIASIVVLALTPIWSAVTKAQAEMNSPWISKLYKVLLGLPAVTLLLGLIALPILQWFFNFWLNENTVTVNYLKAIAMIAFNVAFVMHYVNTNVNNGLSLFRPQLIWMTIGAILMIPLSKLLCTIMGDWTGVIIACTLSILPYEIMQPVITFKFLKEPRRM